MEIQDSIWKLIALGGITISWFAVRQALNKFDQRFDKIEMGIETRFDKMETRLDEERETNKEILLKLTEHHMRISHLEGKPTIRYKQ